MQVAIWFSFFLVTKLPLTTALSSDGPTCHGTCEASLNIAQFTSQQIQAELLRYKSEFGFIRPLRSLIDPSLNWKNGVPNYDLADLLYFQGKSKNHSETSLESVVENLVKKWEMECTHLNFEDWTVASQKSYSISANGGTRYNISQNGELGNYNVLMENVNDDVYDASKHNFESSHELFGNAFLGGFPWEILEVFSAPPRTMWTWRHWGTFLGEFRGRKGDGKLYEMYGIGMADLDLEGKVSNLEIYYKPKEFLLALMGELDAKLLRKGASIVGGGCPFTKSEQND